LPTPIADQFADPLTLFLEDSGSNGVSGISGSNFSHMQEEKKQEKTVINQMTAYDALKLRAECRNKPPSMQIPLGLIDKPEVQQREVFVVDLHGSAGPLTGGPLLIVGAQHSGKATALETMLFWLTMQYTSQQFRCAIIDPSQEFDFFQDLPHFQLQDGTNLWTDGSTDKKINELAEKITAIITQRRADPSVHRWDDQTLQGLWAQGIEVPQVLVVLSHLHSFAERMTAAAALKKLALSIVEARTLGVYLVVTSAEVGSRYVPSDLMGKFSTKVGLVLNEQQRYDLFGRTPVVPDPIPGRGLAITPDRIIHQIQLALPVAGETESQRRESLKQKLRWLQGS
jgi:DNA segregation ATPase FtsK/SpoIIIE-like protein